MERIDIHNYEAYLLDFSEGSLSSDQQMDLELFLIQHPELNIDLNDLSLMSFEKEEIYFAQKNDLRKSETDLVSETQFIAYIENQLPVAERINIEKSCVSNPTLAKDLTLFRRTIIKADLSVSYSNKKKLKRRAKLIWFDFSPSQYSVAAACILFLIGLFVLWPKPVTTGLNTELAEHRTIHPTKNSNSKIAEANPKLNTLERVSIAQNSKNQNKAKITQASSPKTQYSATDTIRLSPYELSPIEELKKNESLIASNQVPVVHPSQNTVVQVITESDEEPNTSENKKKKGLWAIASKALKNLNKVGLKSVNGNEDENKDKSFYALTLGGVNITHKAAHL